MYHDSVWCKARLIQNGGKLNPEDRIPPLVASSVLLPVGFFWFAWTSDESVPWGAQVTAGILIGAGILSNLLATSAYLIDVYLLHANSALAANICVRSAAAAAFPTFAVPMYERLGVKWATSLLGLLCVTMAPFPALLWFCGAKIRGWGRYTPH